MFYKNNFKYYKLVNGYGLSDNLLHLSESQIQSQKLVSFDRALLYSGVGNYNLIKMSSILPPYCEPTTKYIEYEFGSCIPIAYASTTQKILTESFEQIIKANVSVAIPKERSCNGLIMEYSGKTFDKKEILSKEMAKTNFLYRGYKEGEFDIVSSSIYYDYKTDYITLEEVNISYQARSIPFNSEHYITLFAACVLME